MSFGAGRLEGLEDVASEGISLLYASQRMASLRLQDSRLGLLDTWPQHLRTYYQQYQREI